MTEKLGDAALEGFEHTTSTAYTTSEIGHGRSEDRRVLAVKVETSKGPNK